MRRMFSLSRSRPQSSVADRGGFLSSLFSVEPWIVLLVLATLGAALIAGAEPRPAVASQQRDRSRPIRSITIAGADDRHLVVLTDACCFVRDLQKSESYPVWLRVEDERVIAVAGSRADDRVLLCRDNSRMDLHNLETGKNLWRASLLRGDGIAATFSPDGTKLAIATDQKEILIVESQSAEILHSFAVEEAIHSVCFTPCGSRVVAPVSRAEIGMWEIASGRAVARFPVPGGAAKSLAVHPSGDSIAVATYDGTALLMSLANGHVEREWTVTYLPVLNVSFRPDGRELFAARCDGVVSVFSAKHDAPLRQFTAHQDVVRAMTFAGDRLMTGGYDGVVRTWNVSTTREIPLDL